MEWQSLQNGAKLQTHINFMNVSLALEISYGPKLFIHFKKK